MASSTSAPYDEERLDASPTSRRPSPRRKYRLLRSPRLRKVALWLLVADLLFVGLLVRTLEPLITLLHRNEELFGPREPLSPSSSKQQTPQQPKEEVVIPRILHQTCASDEIPEKWVESQRSCKQVYSEFEYKLWTDDLAREFLSVEYPWFVDLWDNYAFPIQRADAIRYFVLHHYGGIYLDMDTYCNETFPLAQIEANAQAEADAISSSSSSPVVVSHIAVLKSTVPTGVTNDFMASSASHPAFAAAVTKLPTFYRLTRPWAALNPYSAIMLSSGPLFLSLVVKDYLLQLPSALPSPTVMVFTPEALAPFITDLESSSWHRFDAQALMWLGRRPWMWFALGAAAVAAGLCVVNYALLLLFRGAIRKVPSVPLNARLAKLA